MKKNTIALLFCLWSFSLLGAYDSTHALFTGLLKKNVSSGVVNYEGIKADAITLDNYILQIKSVTKDQYEKFPRNEQMAYLMNAYNAYTLKLITDFYPVESIRDIGALVGGSFLSKKSKQWKISEYEIKGKKFTLEAMGRPVTLDELEHDTLRPIFKDARVHFALVCGAVSCPFLRSEAYTSSLVSQQLDQQGQQFLSDPFRNRYDKKENKLYLSKIFDWFDGDFKRDAGDVKNFVKKYLAKNIQDNINEETSISFLEYEWTLNNKPGRLQ